MKGYYKSEELILRLDSCEWVGKSGDVGGFGRTWRSRLGLNFANEVFGGVYVTKKRFYYAIGVRRRLAAR